MSGFFDFSFTDLLGGLGAVATAYGSYKSSSDLAKQYEQQMQYEQMRDAKADAKEAQAQNNLDAALDNVYGVNTIKKKKKKDDGTISLDNAYGTIPTTQVA